MASRAKSGSTCQACKIRKIRCLDNEDQSVKCRRCAQCDIPCVYQPVGRSGRPPGPSGSSSRETGTVTQLMASNLSTLQPAAFHSTIMQPPPVAAGVSLPQDHGASMQYSSSSGEQQGRPSSWYSVVSPTDEQNTTRATATEHLDPGSILQTPGSGVSSSLKQDWHDVQQHGDPVSLSLLSLAEANHLVERYHSQLNPYIKLLDPALHSTSYMRSTSTVLFSAVLFASSKFFRKDLHASLESHFHAILNRLVNIASCHIGLIQALMIAVFWKAPTDASAFDFIKNATPLFQWENTRQDKSQIQSEHGTVYFVSQYTLACLLGLLTSIVFDRNTIFDLPWSINRGELGDPEQWAVEVTRLNNPVDYPLTRLHAIATIEEQLRLVRQSEAKSESFNRAFGADLRLRVDSLLGKMTDNESLNDANRGSFVLGRKWLLLHLLFLIQIYESETSSNDISKLSDSVQTASSIVETVEAMSQNDSIQFWHDIAAIRISLLCLALWKHFHLIGPPLQVLVIDLLRRLHQCMQKYSQVDMLSAPTYVARFIDRTLHVLQAEPAPPEMTLTDGQARRDDDWTFNLDEFLNLVPTTTGNNDMMDTEYWNSLFSATPGTSAFGSML